MHKLSHILKSLMNKEQITETELARRTNIGQPVIHRIGSGETDNPKITTLAPLAEYFSITVSQLVGDHPLPSDKQASVQNQKIGAWHKVPLINWRQALAWKEKTGGVEPIRQLATDCTVGDLGFALKIADLSMSPLFRPGTHVIVDPHREPKNQDFVIVLKSGHKTPTLKQALFQEEQILLKTLNGDFNDDFMSEGDRFLGVVVQLKVAREFDKAVA